MDNGKNESIDEVVSNLNEAWEVLENDMYYDFDTIEEARDTIASSIHSLQVITERKMHLIHLINPDTDEYAVHTTIRTDAPPKKVKNIFEAMREEDQDGVEKWDNLKYGDPYEATIETLKKKVFRVEEFPAYEIICPY